MPKRRKNRMEYRYYRMPVGSPILAFLGEKWVQTYGEGIDCLHFHNYMEIAYSKNVGWAALLAEFLTNEESQAERFAKRAIGPTNKNILESDDVKNDAAVSAVISEAEFGVLQNVGGKYWDPVKTLGEVIAQGELSADDEAGIQKALDTLVEGVTAPIS